MKTAHTYTSPCAYSLDRSFRYDSQGFLSFLSLSLSFLFESNIEMDVYI